MTASLRLVLAQADFCVGGGHDELAARSFISGGELDAPELGLGGACGGDGRDEIDRFEQGSAIAHNLHSGSPPLS